MIELKNISKIYHKRKDKVIALNQINLNFDYGNLYAIVGISGSGKSTMLNIIGLLDEPSCGFMYINGNNVLTLSKKNKALLRLKEFGYVFQEIFLIENISVYENIMMPLILNKNLDNNEKNDRVNSLLKLLNLQYCKKYYPDQLSSGEKQKVLIARSLVNNPSIIIADEPTINLNWESEKQIFRLFKKLSKLGKCVIIVSNSKNIYFYADKIIELNNGILI